MIRLTRALIAERLGIPLSEVPLLLTKEQMARLAGRPVSHVERRCQNQEVTYTKQAKTYAFTCEQAQDFLNSYPVVEAKRPTPKRAAQKKPAPAPVPRPRKSAPTPAGGVPTARHDVSRLYRKGSR